MRPDAFAAVMATGIVSIAATDHGWRTVAVVLAVLASIAMLVLICRTPLAQRSWRFGDVDTPVGLLTFVAACCVLATRFDEYRWVVWMLGAAALLTWIPLLGIIIRDVWRLRWTELRDRVHGAWELTSVSTSGLSIVFVAVGPTSWSLVAWPLALLAYAVVAGLVAWRAVHDSARRHDVPPDHWILMGGTAIASLAGVRLHEALPPGSIADVVRAVTIVTWVTATVQIAPLTVVGWRRVRAWSAVFPLGMHSAATHAMAAETRWPALDTLSLVFCWIALALWLLTLARSSRRHVGTSARE